MSDSASRSKSCSRSREGRPSSNSITPASSSRARSKSNSRRQPSSTDEKIDNVQIGRLQKTLSAEDLFADETEGDHDADNEGDSDDPESRKTNHPRMDGSSTSEVIAQLESKNALYKEEFKRVQREKKLLKKEKETILEALIKEMEELENEVRTSEQHNKSLRTGLAEGAGSDHQGQALRETNAQLRLELNGTVERASKMVQQREQAMDDLMEQMDKLKEEHAQVRNMFDVTLYKNKLRMETLDHEIDEYAQKVAELEHLLQEGS